MAFKILSHNLDTKNRLYLDRITGKYIFQEWSTFLKKKDFDIENNISAIELITEENKSSFGGKAGWGVAGSLLLGPIGLLAGVLAGGNKKSATCALEVYPEYKLIAEMDAKAYMDLKILADKNRSKGKTLKESDIIKPPTANEHHFETNITIDDLPKLKSLLDQGIITQDDFDAAKKKIFR